MSEQHHAYIRYRLARAREALDEAGLLLQHAHVNTAINRIYYACFYAVSALLLAQNLSSGTHSGLRHLFGEHFVKTNIIPADTADLFFKLYHYRQRSDYEDRYQIAPQQVEGWLTDATAFVEVIAEQVEPRLSADA